MKYCVVILMLFFACSCNYKWAIRYRKDGKRHIVKEYPNYIGKDDGYEKFVFRTEYKRTSFPSTAQKIFTFSGDSLLTGDSVEYYLSSDSRAYFQIFKLGIISADLLRKYQPESQKERRKDIKTGIIINEAYSIERFFIDLKELHNMRIKKNTRRFKYNIGLVNGFVTFCFELKNEKANRKTPVDSFIKGAHLSFFCQSPFLAI